MGGTKKTDTGDVAVIPGDTYVENMSRKPVRVGGGYIRDAEVLPSSGGFQALLDANVLACEARVLEAMREYHNAVTSMLSVICLERLSINVTTDIVN